MRHRLTAVILLALLGVAGCGGGDRPASTAPRATTAAPPSTVVASSSSEPTPRCRKVPRTTVRLIASHANHKTRFDVSAAAAVDADSGYAVSVVALAGGTQRMATWFVDKLRAPESVTSGNVQALQVTNWPLQSGDAERVRQSQICAAKKLH